MSRRAALYLRAQGGSGEGSEPLEAVRAWLARDGYTAWPALPKGYDRAPEEVRELLYRPAAGGPWAILVPEAFEHLLTFGVELSRPPAGLTVLAVTDTWDGAVKCKLYADGNVILKVGEDRDPELSWFVPLSEPHHFDDAARRMGLPSDTVTALQTWGRAVDRGEAPSFPAVTRAFGLPEPPPRFSSKAAAPYTYLLYLDRRSPLVLNG